VAPPGVQVESASGQRPFEVMVPLRIEPRATPAPESAPAAPPTAVEAPRPQG
jgi:hypothetical protein